MTRSTQDHPRVLDPVRISAVYRTRLLDTGPEVAFDRLTGLAATLLGTPFAFVTLVDETRSFWKSCIGVSSTDLADRQNSVQQSFCRYVIEADAELIVDDARVDPRTADNPSIELMGVAAWAGFPVRSPDGHVLGTFCAVDTSTRHWTPHDIEVLKTLALAAAGEIALREAVENAETATIHAQAATTRANEATADARAAANQAQQLADTLQESLLPPHLPQVPGVEIAVRYRRGAGGTAEVLGDFYDVFPSARDTWAVVVGDVCGKGPQAAKTTALARYTLRATAGRFITPSRNLATLNTTLRAWQTKDPRFLTAAYAALRLHPKGVSAQISCAGHEPALIRRADGRVESFGHHGVAIGLIDQPVLRDKRTVLHPGDSLILYTDGVTEGRRADSSDLFGIERLHRVLAGNGATSAGRLVDAIDNAVTTFTAGHVHDDTVILVIHLPASR